MQASAWNMPGQTVIVLICIFSSVYLKYICKYKFSVLEGIVSRNFSMAANDFKGKVWYGMPLNIFIFFFFIFSYSILSLKFLAS